MKNLNSSSQTYEFDLLRLTTLIRQRESALLMLFEEKGQRLWQKTEWFLKGCEYQQKQSRLSREIRGIIFKWLLMNEEIGLQLMKQIRGFWVKVKMVMKMSLERVKLLGLLSYSLFEQYENIIQTMNIGYDRGAGINHYREIEDMIKNRNKYIQDLLGYAQMPDRVRPIHSVKQPIRDCLSESKFKAQPLTFKNVSQLAEGRILARPLSQQHQKTKFNPKSFMIGRKIKKITNFLDVYQTHLKGAMQGKVDVHFDKKKTIEQNVDMLYDQLLTKNMQNHKMIAKFMYNQSGKALKKLPNKRMLKPLKRPNVEIETPKLKQGKKKGNKALLVVRRAVSAKAPRKQLKDNRVRLSQMLDGENRLIRVKRFV